MKKIAIYAIALMGFLAFSTTTFAQKFGHVNSGNILVSMPETKKADDELLAFQKGLVEEGQKMAEDFKKQLDVYQQKAYVDQTMAPKDMQTEEARLTKLQEGIAKKEQEVMTQVNQKRAELMQPLFKKLQDAIEAVGKEGGYTMIFDSSIPNTILFAEDADDLGAKVKAKLGIQ